MDVVIVADHDARLELHAVHDLGRRGDAVHRRDADGLYGDELGRHAVLRKILAADLAFRKP